MNEQEFTAFRNDGGEICFFSESAPSLNVFMQRVEDFYSDGWVEVVDLIAWAPEQVRGMGVGTCDRVCAESIAAGRIIKQIDGKWVAFGAEPEATKPAQSLGALLRQALERLPHEAQPAGYDQVTGVWSVSAGSPDAAMLVRDGRLARHKPLPGWGQRTPFDNFGGFSVQSETHPDEPTPVHALQRLAEGDPRCGSAWLLGR